MFSFFKRKEPQPQKPISFGWKTCWFCINAEPEIILEKLAKKHGQISWDDAIKRRLIHGKPFLTPCFAGWTILSHPGANEIQADLEKLVGLLNVDVAYFESHRGVDLFGFGWTKNQEVVRVHRQADGQLLENFGDISEEENSLGILPISDFDLEGLTQEQEDEIWNGNPDEEDIVELSGLVSVDPSQIDSFPKSIPFELKIKSSVF